MESAKLHLMLRFLLILAAVTGLATAADPSHVVFLIGEEEYGTRQTLPVFAKEILEPRGYRCSLIFSKSDERTSPDCHEFPGLTAALADADLLIVSTRRRFPPTAEMDLIKKWVADGKPVLGVRTASHAFGSRPKGAGYQPAEGHGSWETFDRDVLGATYLGHFQNKVGADGIGTKLELAENAAAHPVFKGIEPKSIVGAMTTLYQSRDLAPNTKVLMTGIVPGTGEREPVTWTREADGQRIFYTSLGGEADMTLPWLRAMLGNAVDWCLAK